MSADEPPPRHGDVPPHVGFLIPHGVDQFLVMRAQMRAGRRCHQLANLLNSYYLVTRLYNDARADKDQDQWAIAELAAIAAMREQAEANLRKFATGH